MVFIRRVAVVAVLGLSSPVSHAFNSKLSPPWPAGRRRDGRADGNDGALTIVTDGNGKPVGGSRTKRRRRRSASSGSAMVSAGDDTERGALDSDDAELADSEDGSAIVGGEEFSDVNVNGWPNQSSTLRAYGEYLSAAADAGLAVSSASGRGAATSVAFHTPPRGSVLQKGASARSLGRRHASITSANGDNNGNAPKVKDYLGPLLSMTRPDNFPGVILLHVLGAYKTLKQVLLFGEGAPLSGMAEATGPTALTRLLLKVLKEPRMIVTLISLLLTTATSMLVNDYYDARSGVDLANEQSRRASTSTSTSPSSSDPKQLTDAALDGCRSKPLATGAVPLSVAKRFLYYLYASLLLSVPFVPGTPAQLSVILGAMLTFLYTQHLKPVTWLKNALCAGLIAFSPLTSGMATASLVSEPGTFAVNSIQPAVGSISRLVLTLFAGFMSREMLMDVTDVEGDKAAGVQTVPVRHGLRYASRAALGSAVIMAALAVSGPASRLIGAGWSATVSAGSSGELVSILSAVASALLHSRADLIRLGLAALSSGLMVRGAWAVCRSDGRDREAADRAVEEGKMSVLPLLASFI